MRTTSVLLALCLGAWAEPSSQYKKSYVVHEEQYQPREPFWLSEEPQAEPYAIKYAKEPVYPQPQPQSYKPKPSYTPRPSTYAVKPTYEKHYDNKYCDPKTPPPCAYNATICMEDPEYPEYDVQKAWDSDAIAKNKYTDAPYQSADDLVDGLYKKQEDALDYDSYTGPWSKGNWVGPEGYICPSHVGYLRPKRARNVEGQWRVIVQEVAGYTQTLRAEKCLYANAPCRTLAPCYHSRCTQKHVVHRLLSWDPCDLYRGLFIDAYKMPSACSCHIPTNIY